MEYFRSLYPISRHYLMDQWDVCSSNMPKNTWTVKPVIALAPVLTSRLASDKHWWQRKRNHRPLSATPSWTKRVCCTTVCLGELLSKNGPLPPSVGVYRSSEKDGTNYTSLFSKLFTVHALLELLGPLSDPKSRATRHICVACYPQPRGWNLPAVAPGIQWFGQNHFVQNRCFIFL